MLIEKRQFVTGAAILQRLYLGVVQQHSASLQGVGKDPNHIRLWLERDRYGTWATIVKLPVNGPIPNSLGVDCVPALSDFRGGPDEPFPVNGDRRVFWIQLKPDLHFLRRRRSRMAQPFD